MFSVAWDLYLNLEWLYPIAVDICIIVAVPGQSDSQSSLTTQSKTEGVLFITVLCMYAHLSTIALSS